MTPYLRPACDDSQKVLCGNRRIPAKWYSQILPIGLPYKTIGQQLPAPVLAPALSLDFRFPLDGTVRVGLPNCICLQRRARAGPSLGRGLLKASAAKQRRIVYPTWPSQRVRIETGFKDFAFISIAIWSRRLHGVIHNASDIAHTYGC